MGGVGGVGVGDVCVFPVSFKVVKNVSGHFSAFILVHIFLRVGRGGVTMKRSL